MKTIPTHVRVTRTITYDLRELSDSMKELQGIEEPKYDELLDMIHEFVVEDFGCEANLLSFTDIHESGHQHD